MVPDQFSAKSMFHDSDEEDEETKKDEPAKSEPYSGSLVFKPGKNLSTNLYYCDYTKMKGMDRDELNSILNDLANAKAEKEHIDVSLKATRELAATLFSQPPTRNSIFSSQPKKHSFRNSRKRLLRPASSW